VIVKGDVQVDTDCGRRTEASPDCLIGGVQFDYFRCTSRSEELRVMVPHRTMTVTGGDPTGVRRFKKSELIRQTLSDSHVTGL
jgi:hypothetical protein